MQGAGGVGGLLEVTYHGSAITNAFIAYDGNGNVSALVNAGDGTLLAGYEYGPFGEVLRATGPMAKVNPFTFGTYFYDWETDKSYAKNRNYDPSPGRFINRDPMAEPGFELIGQSLLPDNDPSKVNDADGDGPLGFAPQLELANGGTLIEPDAADYEWNRYAFVLNRPTMAVDALGLDITVETGNAGAGPINNRVHQQICVFNCNMEKQCFSFGMIGWQLPEFSKTWLGWKSLVTGAILKGQIYPADPVPGATIYDRHTTTAAQDAKWLQYETTKRLWLTDGYSVGRHNCRTYSQWEFRDAPLHW
jgi:RHS repeat-associated protein